MQAQFLRRNGRIGAHARNFSLVDHEGRAYSSAMSHFVKKNQNIIFLSWVAQSTRSESLARAVGAESRYFAQWASLGILKYIPRSIATMRALSRQQPRAIFCMNPPLVCATIALLWTKLFGGRYVLDSHSAAFDCGKWTWLTPLHAILAREAACSIVTNEELASRVAQFGGRAVIVSDIPFKFPVPTENCSTAEFSVCYVCTFAHDEPYLEVIEAAKALPEIRFYISGNFRKARSMDDMVIPFNVTLTGYLDFQDYANLLHSVSAIMALTTRNFTMQRGGSESVTVGKPLITSNWPTLRRIFAKGAVFVDNSASSIIEGVRSLRSEYSRLQAEMIELRQTREAAWQDAKQSLESALGFSLPAAKREDR